jgi:hypothetical protein
MLAHRLAQLSFAVVLALTPCAVQAAASPTPAPSPNTAEATFLAKIMADLPQRYPNPKAAAKAGYVRYSNEDSTGAISYVNTKYWDTTDPDLPAQLWYDVNGRLLGADFSVPRNESSSAPPARFGLDASRWHKIGAHVHYVARRSDGGYIYGKAVSTTKYASANNGSYTSPTAAGLVAAGAVANPAMISSVFLYPAIYDVSVWVVPNPLGQFADANPTVIPSANAGKGEDM